METPAHTVLDPVVLYLDDALDFGTPFRVTDIHAGMVDEGFDFTLIQVRRAVYYLQRAMGLVEGHGDGWFRWVGSAELYDERRGAAGNYQRWVDDNPYS